MPDMAKVIKGLTACRKTICESCPYNASGEENTNPICFINEMISDALALLKEQETDIGNLNETVKNLLNAYTEIKAIYGDGVRVVGELVRCKDCKAWKQYDDMNLGECELYPEYNKMGDWFCNFGERKESR